MAASKEAVMLLPASGLALAVPQDEALLARCVSGDQAACRDLYLAYYPVAGAFLRKLGVRDAELEDAVQEVFAQLFRYLPGFRGDSQLKTWLYKLCVTQARKVRRGHAVSKLLARWFGAEDPPVTGLELSEATARKRVEQSLERMNEGERLVLVLYEFEGLSGDEIARIAGCPVATVWRRLHYARKRFAESLDMSVGAKS
jgi:RNA polymerase sigma-70 factor (ECF subfamily)